MVRWPATATAAALTPTPTTGPLNRRSRIFLKLENLQPAGSFKSRGVGNMTRAALARAADPRRVHFYVSSGGNAGLACVHAARALGSPSTVVVPTSTKPLMVAKVRAAGASAVCQHGANWSEADAYMREVLMREGAARGEEAVYVPPFDHADVWAGNETLIPEVRAQLAALGEGPPDVVACSVGGGGLFNGLVQGVEAEGPAWEATTVLAVETAGADALAHALDAGELVTLPAITSLATSLGAPRVSARTFELATRHRASGRVRTAVLSDAEAAMGCWRFADDERLLVELACGVTVALCYGGRLQKAMRRPVAPDEIVVIVVCGGSAVTMGMLEGWREEFGAAVTGPVDAHNTTVPSATTVLDGVKGVNGTNGVKGANGINGVNGTTGVNGTSGTNGVIGTNGTNGVH